jgi:hypothetical protein
MQRQMADLEIETVEVTTNPLSSWQDGIRMIPALRGGNKIVSGLLISHQEIRSFIENIRAGK